MGEPIDFPIRPAAPGDAAAICALLMVCDLSAHGVLVAQSRYWLVERDGEIIGAVGLELAPGAALLRSAAIRPDVRV